MKILLSEGEKQYIEKYAKDYNVSVKGLTETYLGVMNCNFEQDIIDILNENADDIRQDDGEYIDKAE